MRDDNLRRLLHYSVRERRAALQKFGAGAKADDIAQRHFALVARQDGTLDAAIEEGLARLGVRTVWLENYKQLPDHLGFVYEGGGYEWESVF